jgi:hypothetical protein
MSSKEMDETGEKGVAVEDDPIAPLSHHKASDSLTSVEAAAPYDHVEARDLTRKLLRKLDTRCVFLF